MAETIAGSRPARKRPGRLRGVGKYWAILRMSLASSLAYINEIAFRAVVLVALMVIFVQLWQTTYSAQPGAHLGAFTIRDIIWYLALVETLATSVPALNRRVDGEVRSGDLAYLLGRPCNYVFYQYAHYLGERVVRLAMAALVASTLALIFVGPPPISLWGLLAGPLVFFLSISIDFGALFAIGLLAFWTEETESFALIYSRLVLVLGGVLVPLELFPEPLGSIARVLPFAALLYGPARTIIKFDLAQFGGLLIQQGLTLAALALVVAGIYRLAVRRVNINGG
ncbi:MAG TPA: ABC-2 family transporter protein [Ktedonobacterales bacterium]|jgi:ABC-2 type transport system permease protein